MVAERLTWVPPTGGGDPIVFTPEGEGGFLLRRFTPAGNEAGALSTAGPRQMGRTFSSPEVGAASQVASVYVLGETEAAHVSLRAKLSRALAVDSLAASALGTLRLERPGLPTVETPALAVDSPGWGFRGAGYAEADLEWWTPSPYWASASERVQAFGVTGGEEYPLEYPLGYEPISIRSDVENLGDVSVGATIRIFGAMENPAFTLVGTGEKIVLTGSLAADESLEVKTGYGQKAVTLIAADGLTRTNAFGWVDLDETTFWRLPPGVSEVELSFASTTDGSATMTWRDAYGGA